MKIQKQLKVENLFSAIIHWEGYYKFYEQQDYHNHLKAQRDFLKKYIKPWIKNTVNDVISKNKLNIKLVKLNHKYFKNKKYIKLTFDIDTSKYIYSSYEEEFKKLYYKLVNLFWQKELILLKN